MMRWQDFLIQSPNGGTHAINPKTDKTYCGVKPPETWRPLDVLPSNENPPTCKVCQCHYDDPLKEEMLNIVKDVKQNISEFLDLCVMLKDVKGLGRFVTSFKDFLDKEKKQSKEVKA